MAAFVCQRCGQESPSAYLREINHALIRGRDVCTSQRIALQRLANAIERPHDLFERAEREARVQELNCVPQARERGLL